MNSNFRPATNADLFTLYALILLTIGLIAIGLSIQIDSDYRKLSKKIEWVGIKE